MAEAFRGFSGVMRGGNGTALLQRDNINRLQMVRHLAVRGGGSVDAGAGTGVLQREGFLVRGIIGGQSFSDGSRGGIRVFLGVEDFQLVLGSVRIVILGNEALAGGTAAALKVFIVIIQLDADDVIFHMFVEDGFRHALQHD